MPGRYEDPQAAGRRSWIAVRIQAARRLMSIAGRRFSRDRRWKGSECGRKIRAALVLATLLVISGSVGPEASERKEIGMAEKGGGITGGFRLSARILLSRLQPVPAQGNSESAIPKTLKRPPLSFGIARFHDPDVTGRFGHGKGDLVLGDRQPDPVGNTDSGQ
jgi:hypothetical protein